MNLVFLFQLAYAVDAAIDTSCKCIDGSNHGPADVVDDHDAEYAVQQTCQRVHRQPKSVHIRLDGFLQVPDGFFDYFFEKEQVVLILV